jgi:alpha-L-rhamnosidase
MDISSGMGLWEHKDTSASMNHGFASHVIHWLYKDLLGIEQVDHARRLITVRPKRCGLHSCSGTIPTPDGGTIELAWRLEEGTMFLQVDTDASYTIDVKEYGGLYVTGNRLSR